MCLFCLFVLLIKKLQYSIFQNRGNKLDMASDEEDSIYLLCLLGFGTWKIQYNADGCCPKEERRLIVSFEPEAIAMKNLEYEQV